MKLGKILKAFFFPKEEPVELDLSAAEISEGKAFLHPKNEAGVTYLVHSDNIEISLSKGFSLSPEHIIKMEPKPSARKLSLRLSRSPSKKPILVLPETRSPSHRLLTMNLTSTRSASLLCPSIRMNMISLWPA